jgi:hypothetical protein
MNLGTWKQILLTTIGISFFLFQVCFGIPNRKNIHFYWFVDLLLILEHSFYLFHQKDSQPLLSAAQKYKASNIPKQVKSAMKGVFDQYKKATKEEKIKMLVNVILQNRMSMLSISSIFI